MRDDRIGIFFSIIGHPCIISKQRVDMFSMKRLQFASLFCQESRKCLFLWAEITEQRRQKGLSSLQ